MVILSFKNKETELLFREERNHGFPADVARRALVKLQALDFAQRLGELNVPPGNRLEALRGSRDGQHSIRVNDKWRICFVWTVENNAADVEIVDYH